MSDPARDLEAKALTLPTRERARLAERLIASLEPGVDPEAEALWLTEAERRLSEIESGATEPVPADRVFEKARSTLR